MVAILQGHESMSDRLGACTTCSVTNATVIGSTNDIPIDRIFSDVTP